MNQKSKRFLHKAGVAWFQRLLKESGCIPQSEVLVRFCGNKPATPRALSRAVRLGKVVSVDPGNDSQLAFPSWQFAPLGGVIKGLPKVLRILRSRPTADDLGILIFLTNPTARLGDKCPSEVLQEGSPESIAQVAQLARESLE